MWIPALAGWRRLSCCSALSPSSWWYRSCAKATLTALLLAAAALAAAATLASALVSALVSVLVSASVLCGWGLGGSWLALRSLAGLM